MTSFQNLGLAAPILKALDEEGYAKPTPIQSRAIQPIMEGRDILGIAQTGTGKTAAFALPILHRLAADPRPAPRKGCRALILSPTRELASQIGESFRTYGRHLGFSVAVVFGGVAPRPQIQALSRGVDILVATPGRLLDHMGERHADISGTEIFVLDEADQMLDLGFVKPIRRIVSQLAHRRQNLFFSATMPKEISGLASELLRDPVKVEVTPVATTAERVSQRVIFIEAGKKRTVLKELLSDATMERTLVFTRTKRGADRVAHTLDQASIKSVAIHGNKSQRQRENALEAFRRGDVRVLVATDIAARGIDIDLVSHVVNYELPEVPEAYVHRIGRTARAGASGMAISLCDNEERDLLRAIERTTRQQIPHEDRRNDPTIIAPPRTESRSEDRPDPRRRSEGRPGRSSEGRPGRSAEGRTARHAEGQRGDGRRAEGRSERHAEGRPARRAEGRPEYRGEGRTERHTEGARGEGRRHEGRPNDRRTGEQRQHERSAHTERPARGDDRRNDARTRDEAPRARDGADAPRHRENHRQDARNGDQRSRDHQRREGGDRPRRDGSSGSHGGRNSGNRAARDGGDRREHGGSLSSVGFLKRPSGHRGTDRAGQ